MALVGVAARALDTPNDHSDLVKTSDDDQGVRPIQWKLAIEEGGPIMEFNGSLQEVEKQIQAIKADFKFTPIESPNNTVALNELDTTRMCLPMDQQAAAAYRTQQNIDYLRGLGDTKCGDNGGSDGQSCGQISCSWGSAIKWCNMGANYYETKCSDFADYAQDILNNCQSSNRVKTHGYEDVETPDYHFRVRIERSKC
ncbi:hypothetical protein PG989_015232 [Apiospora arundinis]|uniref:Secreted protein n=1 Tax=Apiospora arundinis TaxID=335852 RepID=A0ABR2JN06_9PEZI